MPKKLHIIYSALARYDLKVIAKHHPRKIKNNSTFKQVQIIIQKINHLSLYPDPNTTVTWEPWHSLGIKELLVGDVVVFYEINQREQEINIIRILYTGEDGNH